MPDIFDTLEPTPKTDVFDTIEPSDDSSTAYKRYLSSVQAGQKGDIFDKIAPVTTFSREDFVTSPGLVKNWDKIVQQEQVLSGYKPNEEPGFFAELGKSMETGTYNVLSGIGGTVEDLSVLADKPGLNWIGKHAGKMAEGARWAQKAPSIQPAEVDSAKIFIAQALGSTIPFMAVTVGAALTGGIGTAAVVSFAVEGENAYQNAIATGASKWEAETERTIVGGLNALIEFAQLTRIFKTAERAKPFFKTLLHSARNKAWFKVAQTGGAITGEIVKSAFEEGLEEALQGTTSEAVPYILRRQSPEGGISDFLIRRAMEFAGGAIGGAFFGGFGGVAGTIGEQFTDIQLAKKVITESTDLTPEQKIAGEQYIGDIETNIVKDIVDKFPGTIDSQASLEQIGDGIKDQLGITDKVYWDWSSRRTRRLAGWHSKFKDGHKIKVFNREFPSSIKRTIVHELGHIAKEPTRKGSYGKRQIHHKEFKQWVTENIKKLHEERIVKEPIHREEAIGPIRPVNTTETIVNAHNTTGGSTIALKTGARITKGFAVSPYPDRTMVIPGKEITSEQIKEFKDKNAAILSAEPDVTIGTWFNEADGKTYIDLTIVKSSKEDALALGKERKQLAIYDLEKGEEISIEAEPTKRETYKGPAYRSETGLKAEGTAADVVRYEQKELGNDLGVSEAQLKELEKRPASDIMWVARNKETAAEYGPPEDVKDVTNVVKNGEIIAEIPDGVLVLKPIKEARIKKKPRRVGRKKALALGHTYPDILGMSEDARRDFMEQATGKRTMKGMSLDEMRQVVDAYEAEMETRGLKYEKPELPTEQLIATLEETKKTTEKPLKETINRRGIYKLVYNIKKEIHNFFTGMFRIERMLEGFDGHKEGIFYNTIWRPMKDADESSTERTNSRVEEFITLLENKDVDAAIWTGRVDEIPGTDWKLTAFQRIGTYVRNQNKNGRRYLRKGMGFTESDIKAVIDFMSPQEKAQAEWFLEQYEQQWPIIQVAAAQAGIDLVTLKKEFRYAPLVRTDAELEEQEDFLSQLAEPFQQESFSPEKKMLEERKKGAVGAIELDESIVYMHNLARVERFIAMAPTANKIGRILNDKNFKRALNNRTYGQGSKILNSWMKDTIRGTSSKTTGWMSKKIAILRRNGILYAIGYNVPSSLRQTLSFSNAVAVDPLMLKHAPANLAIASTPSGYRTMEEFVLDRSSLVRTREYDRDLRQKWNQQNIKLKLQRKAPWSKKVMRWIHWMDKHTVVVAWKSLYDTATEKRMDEKTAIEFADKWVGRTQPMANAKDLPDFFRGGQLEKLLTTFQNQINNNGNFYAYDIVGAKRAGKIDMTMVAYRTMFSYVLPAIMFGMIGRADMPRTWKQILTDLLTYPVAPLVVIGRWLDRIIRGWGQSETIAGTGPEAAVKLGRSALRGDIPGILKYAAQTVGAFTGRVPSQAIRTVEGAIDLAAGTTKDPRRLIYSKWALEQGQPKKKGKKGKYYYYGK